MGVGVGVWLQRASDSLHLQRVKNTDSEIFAEVGVGIVKSKSKEYQRTLELSSKTIKLMVLVTNLTFCSSLVSSILTKSHAHRALQEDYGS